MKTKEYGLKCRLLYLGVLLVCLFCCGAACADFTLPANLREIGEDAFAGDHRIDAVTLPDNLERIDVNAFRNSSAVLYASMVTNTAQALGRSGYSFSLPGTSSYSMQYLYENGYSTGLKLTSVSKNVTSFTVPAYITYIGERAFYNCMDLTHVTISPSAVVIGREAFRGCGSLLDITLPEGLAVIESRAFQDCFSLRSVTIYASVAAIADDAFDGTSLSTIFGEAGSCAQAYAETHGIRFVPIQHYNPVNYRALLITNIEFGLDPDREPIDDQPNAAQNRETMLAVLPTFDQNIQIIPKENVEFGNIDNLIRDTFAGADDNDVSIIYLTSHGSNVASSGHNGWMETPGGYYYAPSSLKNTLSNLKGTYIIIADYCGSGLVPETFKNEDRIIAFSACAKNELSWGEENRASFYTKTLGEALGGSGRIPADKNGDGLTVKELQEYLVAGMDQYQRRITAYDLKIYSHWEHFFWLGWLFPEDSQVPQCSHPNSELLLFTRN